MELCSCHDVVRRDVYHWHLGWKHLQRTAQRQASVSYRSENDLSMPMIAKTILSATASASGRHDPTPERVGG